MLRRKAAQWTAVAVIVWLGALLIVERHDQAARERSLERLRRRVALVNELIVSHERELLAVARRVGVNPRLSAAVRRGTVSAAANALWRELSADGVEALWILDSRGRPLAARGSVDNAAPLPGNELLSAALAGSGAYGVRAGRLGLNLEAVAPIGPEDRALPVGALRVSRPLDHRTIRDIEYLGDVEVAARPHAFVVAPDELAQLRGPVDERASADAISSRAAALAEREFGSGAGGYRTVGFAQLQDQDRSATGVLAVSMRAEPPHTGLARLLLVLAALTAAGGLAVASPATGHRLSRWLARSPAPPAFTEPWQPLDDPLRRVVHGLSHHLNNNLAVVVGNLELAQRTGAVDSQSQPLRDVVEGAMQAARLVRLLQKATYREPLSWRMPVNLGEAWRQALQQTQARGGAMRRVELTGLEGCQVAGLPDDLVEAFGQLLRNAFEATGPDGTVRVTGESAGDRVVVTVTDDGEGMDEETQRRADELFFSTRGPREAGLGLPVVAGVMARHSGTWSLISEPGQGCTVRLELPAWDGPDPDQPAE